MPDDPNVLDELAEAHSQGKLFEAVCLTERYKWTVILADVVLLFACGLVLWFWLWLRHRTHTVHDRIAKLSAEEGDREAKRDPHFRAWLRGKIHHVKNKGKGKGRKKKRKDKAKEENRGN